MANLTEREKVIYNLLVERGLKDTEIAMHIGGTANSVKQTIAIILEKMFAKNRLDLVLQHWKDKTSNKLSPREKEVLALILSEGKTNKEISLALGISVNAIAHMTTCIFAKTGYTNRTALAVGLLHKHYANKNTGVLKNVESTLERQVSNIFQ